MELQVKKGHSRRFSPQFSLVFQPRKFFKASQVPQDPLTQFPQKISLEFNFYIFFQFFCINSDNCCSSWPVKTPKLIFLPVSRYFQVLWLIIEYKDRISHVESFLFFKNNAAFFFDPQDIFSLKNIYLVKNYCSKMFFASAMWIISDKNYSNCPTHVDWYQKRAEN